MRAYQGVRRQLERVPPHAWRALAYLLVIAMFGVGLYQINELSDARDQDQVERLVDNCEVTNANRANSNERLRNLLVYLLGANVETPRGLEIMGYYDRTNPEQTDCSKLRVGN